MKTMILAAAALLAPGTAVQAIAPVAGDWTAWIGCWRAIDDAADAIVCVLPGSEPEAVRMVTIADGAVTGESVLRADGVARPLDEGGCTGTERAWFSADGRRVYTRAELDCAGMQRVSTGVIGMLSVSEWVDAQSLRVGGQHAGRVVRYRAVSRNAVPAPIAAQIPQDRTLAVEAARMHAAAPLDVAAVIEASRAVDAPAVEALLGARQEGFSLSGDRLRQLAAAGVAPSTIDVMVALSYPRRFAVSERVEESFARPIRPAARMGYRDRCYDAYGRLRSDWDCYDAGFGYSPYSYRRGYYYSPYGYDPLGWRFGNNGTVVVITRPEREPSQGSVTKQSGYTRTGTRSGTATPRGATRSGDSAAPARTSSGSGNATSGSGSSGSGSSSSGETRQAKPRGGNN